LSRGELITLALEIVSNQTGYTVDMLRRSLDMVLDEELGIDAVEKKEVVQALCQTFQLEMPGSHQLIDFPTLSHILDYLLVNTIGDSQAEGAMTAETSLRPTASSIGDRLTRAAVEKGEGKPIEFAITDTVLMIAAEHSGIPSPALDVAANRREAIKVFGTD
ncbi:MAG: hypothetical protein ACK2T3_15980, partial [Candidatus Promineifilaceae bacterium]